MAYTFAEEHIKRGSESTRVRINLRSVKEPGFPNLGRPPSRTYAQARVEGSPLVLWLLPMLRAVDGGKEPKP